MDENMYPTRRRGYRAPLPAVSPNHDGAAALDLFAPPMTPGPGFASPMTPTPPFRQPMYAPGSETSADAARAIAPAAGRLRRRVLAYLRDAVPDAGATRAEIASALGMKENTVNGRVAELLASGHATEGEDAGGVKLRRTGRAVVFATGRPLDHDITSEA